MLLLSFLLRYIVEILFPPVIPFLSSMIPYHAPLIGTTFFSFILSFSIAEIGNRTFFKDQSRYIKNSIRSVGNELELLLEGSFSNAKLLEFTLDTNKVYIGWVKELPIPSVTNYIRIIPAISGYRNEKKKLILTTQYLEVYANYIAHGRILDIKKLNVDLILTLDNLVNVSYFDHEMYDLFKNQENERKPEN